jgi:MerR family transcriptional regulator, light-induced transcriptional regulator
LSRPPGAEFAENGDWSPPKRGLKFSELSSWHKITSRKNRVLFLRQQVHGNGPLRMTSTFTPKQVALALGVSESSVKRWVDSGRLSAGKTLGGHRKLALSAVVDMVRETGQELTHPEVLGMVAQRTRRDLAESQPALLASLLAGNSTECRELLLGYYQAGSTPADIADKLVRPVFFEIGEGWRRGEVQIHQERRACQVVIECQHELRRWIPTPEPCAPLAVLATPDKDFAEVPIRFAELTLQRAGWNTWLAGAGLPLTEIADAVKRKSPSLTCLSVTHIPDTSEEFFGRYMAELVEPTRGYTTHVLGGGAVSGVNLADSCVKLASSMNDLESFALAQTVPSASSPN